MEDHPTDKTPNNSAPTEPELELWSRQKVLAFFGGDRPLHASTLYRGLNDGIYPKPINTSPNAVRWLASECKGALDRMLSERGKPKPPSNRGRKRGASAAKAKTAAAAEPTT